MSLSDPGRRLVNVPEAAESSMASVGVLSRIQSDTFAAISLPVSAVPLSPISMR